MSSDKNYGISTFISLFTINQKRNLTDETENIYLIAELSGFMKYT